MNIKKAFIILSLGCIALLSLSGCDKGPHPAESQLPWAKPAAWEGQAPSMAF